MKPRTKMFFRISDLDAESSADWVRQPFSVHYESELQDRLRSSLFCF